ncbi:nuclear transport factor 2 family protein [Mycobacterium sp. 1245805.9]|uniref:nuclear transport factor 2 family protein n=1 Tax=Mycobacterium sp. 1245805.9 TaxID=1856862 RepID=UPI0012E9D21E|nr:nuclear transport factor 2 family protein [Mycobacterium sp. 1245805.9]
MMNDNDMVELWEQHTRYEFECRDADLAVSTMVPEARVMHLPTMSGASGRDALRAYYADVFIPGQPPDTELDLIARSIGEDVLVDECIMRLTHDREVPQLLPGVAPTGVSLEVAFVVIVRFRDSLMLSETLYWDQAQVLRQAGLLSAATPPLPDTSDMSSYLRASRIR